MDQYNKLIISLGEGTLTFREVINKNKGDVALDRPDRETFGLNPENKPLLQFQLSI